MRRALVLLLLAFVVGSGLTVLFTGCGDKATKASVVPLDEVPETLREKAKATLPEVNFDHARKLSNGNFEVRGKAKNGKVREVEMTPAGEVVEIE
jgi:hypothetical protein